MGRAALKAREKSPLELLQETFPHLGDLEWRLDNLYWIVTKTSIVPEGDGFDPAAPVVRSKEVQFRLKPEQRDFIRNLWPRNIILKSRQIGFSTLLQILQLDQAIFEANHSGVVIADTLPNAGELFQKIEFAYVRLPEAMLEAFPLKSRESRSMIEFAHGSKVRVSTSSRGGTVDLLHVSELGKISRKFPERAEDIVTGSFESVPLDGCIVVESTAEGAFGQFWDLCKPAIDRWREKAPETRLDWRLHFYPWFNEPAYCLPDADADMVVVRMEDHKYFRELEAKEGIKLTKGQKAWYVKKRETLGRKIKQEYPATPEEAFEVAIEGAIFAEEMARVRELGRITDVPIDPNYPVSTFWDLGTGDKTAIWLMQHIAMQKRWIRFHADSHRSLRYWWNEYLEPIREEFKFRWGKHFLPHDADNDLQGEIITTKKAILEGLAPSQIFEVVSRVPDKAIAIDLMRQKLPVDNWFDRVGCADGILAIDGYQFEWDAKLARWSREPLHNWASDGVDAWMQYAQGYAPYNLERQERSIQKFANRASRWR